MSLDYKELDKQIDIILDSFSKDDLKNWLKMTEQKQHIKNMAEIFAANIAEFEIGDLVKEANGIVSKITNKTINSIEVEIDKLPLKKGASKENIGIKARQWFTMENFNRRFKK